MGEALEEEEKKAFTRPGGLYSGGGANLKKPGGVSNFLKKKGPLIASLALVFVVFFTIPLIPSILIGTIKENLLRTLGFKSTVAVLEEQAEYVVSEMALRGEMPEGLYVDFLTQGIEVGQVTLAGEFIPTNVYIADIDGEVAANGDYESHGNGELALRFKGEVISAGDFVATVEANPALYAAFSEAVDISARFYYSTEVNNAYKSMGLDRNAFASWEATGDEEKDQESFNEVLEQMLNADMEVNTASAYNGSKGTESWDKTTTGNSSDSVGDAKKLIDNTANNSRENAMVKDEHDNSADPNRNAAQLLSMSLSSGESYSSAKAFLAVVESIEQAQAGDNGPVNYVMNALSTPNEVTYYDTEKNTLVTTNEAILESANFVAAVSDSDFSKEEAENFGRDRVLKMTGMVDNNRELTNGVIKSTVVSSTGGKKTGLGIVMNNNGSDSASAEVLNDAANNSVAIGLMEKNSDLFATTVGANRIVEGGSFLSNSINQYALGAMPSDEGTVIAYQKEVNKVIARQKAAERATKSPFDISSPNTFMGSLVRKIAMASLPGYGKGGSVLSSFGNSVFGVAKSAFSGLVSSTMADGSEEEFATMMGECITVGLTGASCDLFGTAHTTVNTDYMSYDKARWISELSGDLDENGDVKDSVNDLVDFIMLGMGRSTTVGVSSYEVCKRWKETHYSPLQKVTSSIMTGADKLTEACAGSDGIFAWLLGGSVPEDVRIGTRYTFSDSNEHRAKMEKYSAFVLYDTVSSLLENKTSRVSVYRAAHDENFLLNDELASEYASINQ